MQTIVLTMMHTVGAGFARPDDVLHNFSLGRQTLPLQWAETEPHASSTFV